MWQKYYTVTSIEETLQILAEHKGTARVVAGATRWSLTSPAFQA
jgi:CO/xanthine dehydrogenase FAD-binding subunit